MPDAVAVIGRDEVAGFDTEFFGDVPIGGIAIGTEHNIGEKHRSQGLNKIINRGIQQQLVEFKSDVALHRNHHLELLAARAVLVLSTPFLRRARQALLLLLMRDRNRGFVRLNHALKI